MYINVQPPQVVDEGLNQPEVILEEDQIPEPEPEPEIGGWALVPRLPPGFHRLLYEKQRQGSLGARL